MDGLHTLRVVMYARVSSQAQEQRRNSQLKEASLDEQLAQMRREANRRDWTIVDELRDTIPGATPVAERPAGSRVYQHLAADDFDLLMVYDNDRIGRDQDAMVAKVFRTHLRQARKQVYSVYQPAEPKAPADYLPYDDDAALWLETVTDTASSVAIRQFRRRSAFGMRKRVETKKLTVGSAPIGYVAERHQLPNGKTAVGKRLKDPAYAPIIQRIFNEYELGKSFLNVARTLNAEGIRTPAGNIWTCTTINGILDNPVYYGAAVLYKHRSTGKPHPRKPGSHLRRRQPVEDWLIVDGAQHPAIITKEQWLRCQEIRRSRRNHGRIYGESHLLAGLAKCGHCGRGMYRSGGASSRKHSVYLACSLYKLTKGKDCYINSISIQNIEDQVVSYLCSLPTQPKWREQLGIVRVNDAIQRQQERCRVIKSKLRPLDERAKRIRRAYEAGVDSLEEYRRHKESLDTEQRALQHQHREAEQQIAKLRREGYRLETLDELLSEFSRKFTARPLRIQKLLIRLLVDKVVVIDKRVDIVFHSSIGLRSEYDETLKIIRAYSDSDEPPAADANRAQ